MSEARDALTAHYRQMRADLLASIEGVPDELLMEPTLDGWSVKDHLGHIALWDELRASEVARISAGHESVWRMTSEQDAALNGLSYALRGGLSMSQARWELEATHQRLLDAIASATQEGLDPSRYGEAGLLSRHEGMHIGWIRRWREEQGL